MQKYPEKIKEIRAYGLLIGIELDEGIAKDVFKALFDNGILTSLCGGNTIRIAPPLIIGKGDVDLFINTLDAVLG